LHSGDVPRKTQWWKIRRALYMVTGLRTARGATLVTSESEKSDFRASTEGDATAKGIAFKAGVGAKRAKAASKAVGAKDMSDFVFAYRLSKVTWRLWVSQHPFEEGEALSTKNQEYEDGSVEGDIESGGAAVLRDDESYEVARQSCCWEPADLEAFTDGNSD